MDRASELKIAADKVAKHVAEIAPDLSDEEAKMLHSILELPLMFPIVGKVDDDGKVDDEESHSC